MQTQAVIYYSRIGKELDIYIEGFLCDDGYQLSTRTVITPEFGSRWSKRLAANGLLQPGQLVFALQKHHFYSYWFGIMELLDQNDTILGYYCDVLTPLRKDQGRYYLLDLLLDLWIYPNGTYRELDWDEFNTAVDNNLLNDQNAQQAAAALRWMVRETEAGRFPVSFLASSPNHTID